MSKTVATRLRENATGIVALVITGTWLAALLSGQGWWLPFMLFGYIVVVPVVAILLGDKEDIAEWWDDETASQVGGTDRAERDESDPLETLRDRYARGELTDEEFERKLDRLLETEPIEDVSASRAIGGRELDDDVE